MNAEQLNRVSRRTLILLAVVALLTVLSGFAQPPQADEGAAAHIFQLSVVGFVLTLCLFLVTADWKRPSRSARPLALPASVLTVAFGALYYLEHFRG